MVVYFHVKEWIMDQWERNYYITALAGANNGSLVVVMSKGKAAKACSSVLGAVWMRTWPGRCRQGSDPSHQAIEIDGLGRLPGVRTKQPLSV